MTASRSRGAAFGSRRRRAGGRLRRNAVDSDAAATDRGVVLHQLRLGPADNAAVQASLAFLYCLQRMEARSWRRAASCCSAAVGAALSAAIGLVVGAARRRDGRRRAVCQRASSSAWSGEGSPAEGSRAECCFGLAYL